MTRWRLALHRARPRSARPAPPPPPPRAAAPVAARSSPRTLAVDLHRDGHLVVASQAGSASGHGASASSPSWPSRCHISSARCGIIGPSSRTSVSSPSRSSAGAAGSPVERLERVGQLADQRHGLVEVEPLELLGDRRDRPVDRAPQRDRRRATARFGSRLPPGGSRVALRLDQPPQPVDIAPGAVDAGLGPFEVALGRAVGQHEQPRGVGAVGLDRSSVGSTMFFFDLLIFSTRPTVTALPSSIGTPAARLVLARPRPAAASRRPRPGRSGGRPCPA